MRGIDLFCGAGGLSHGLSMAGIDILASYDNWDKAIGVYTHNKKNNAYKMDLMDTNKVIKHILPYKPDIIAGGPPCQDFSSAGCRVEGGRAILTIAYVEIISKIKPALVLMENVPRIQNSKTYLTTKQTLESLGYQIFERVLDANYCGVPQVRKRFFMFGWRTDKNTGELLDEWIDKKVSKKRLSVKGYLKDSINIEHYYRHPRNYSRRAIFSVHEPSPTVRGVNRPVPPNYCGNHLDSALPHGVRPLTYKERARIQTFPASWKWLDSNNRELSKTNVELLIGNAVPVNLAKFIGRGIVHAVG